MSTIGQKLTQLEQDREDFVDNLTAKGIEDLTGDETFTQLVPRVLDISTGQIIQYEEVPTASEETVGQIIQYIGDTTQDYTNGYFYKGITDGGDPATYSWENVEVQDSGLSEDQVKTLINNAGAIEINQDVVTMLREYYSLGENDLLMIGHLIKYYGGGIYKFKNVSGKISNSSTNSLAGDEGMAIILPGANWYVYFRLYTTGGAYHTNCTVFSASASNITETTEFTSAFNDMDFGIVSATKTNVVNNFYRLFRETLLSTGSYVNIDGQFTFRTMPQVSNASTVKPTDSTHFTTKKYVDDLSTADLSNLAAAYDGTSTYNVGDYVIYDHVLYVCDQDIDVPEAFDDTKWSAVTINEVISNIEINELDANDLDEIINGSL